MNMTLEGMLSYFLAILIFSITPGPGVFAILARALVKGSNACIMLALGMSISDILYLVAACYGLAAIATHWADVFTFIRVIGAIYLVYLGWKMWTAPLEMDNPENTSGQSDLASSFLQGFLISASNPKVILFYIAFLPTFIDLSTLKGGDILLASLLTLVGLMAGLMLIALLASKAKHWFRSEIAMKRLNRSAGSIMVSAGAYLASRH